MRHHNNVRKFGRDKSQKKALLSSLALNLIVREKIKTTEPKANSDLTLCVAQSVFIWSMWSVNSFKAIKYKTNRCKVRKNSPKLVQLVPIQII